MKDQMSKIAKEAEKDRSSKPKISLLEYRERKKKAQTEKPADKFETSDKSATKNEGGQHKVMDLPVSDEDDDDIVAGGPGLGLYKTGNGHSKVTDKDVCNVGADLQNLSIENSPAILDDKTGFMVKQGEHHQQKKNDLQESQTKGFAQPNGKPKLRKNSGGKVAEKGEENVESHMEVQTNFEKPLGERLQKSGSAASLDPTLGQKPTILSSENVIDLTGDDKNDKEISSIQSNPVKDQRSTISSNLQAQSLQSFSSLSKGVESSSKTPIGQQTTQWTTMRNQTDLTNGGLKTSQHTDQIKALEVSLQQDRKRREGLFQLLQKQKVLSLKIKTICLVSTHYHTMPHFDTLKIYSFGKHCEKRRNCL